MIGEGEFLKHEAAPPDGADPVVAPLTPGQLELDEPLAAVGQNGEPHVGDPGPAVEPLNGPHELQDLEVREGGDGAKRDVGAAMKLELLQGRAALSEGHETGFRCGRGDEGEATEVGTALGNGRKAGVESGGGDEWRVADGGIEIGIQRDGDGVAGEDKRGRGRGEEGGGKEVKVGEVWEAPRDARERRPVKEDEATAEAVEEAEPSLADEGGGGKRGVREGGEKAEEELIRERGSEVRAQR